MKPMRIGLVAVLSVCYVALLGTLARTQSGSGYAIAVIPVKQLGGNPPLQILSVSMEAKRDLLSAVEVQNVSQKVIVRYSLGWHIRNAVPATRGYRPGKESYGFAMGKAVQTELEPGMVEKAPPQGVLPSDCDRLLAEKGASQRVFILVGVTEVTFGDGSKWSADAKEFAGIGHPQSGSRAVRFLAGLVPLAMAQGKLCDEKLCWKFGG